jgi:hypothetical protein
MENANIAIRIKNIILLLAVKFLQVISFKVAEINMKNVLRFTTLLRVKIVILNDIYGKAKILRQELP